MLHGDKGENLIGLLATGVLVAVVVVGVVLVSGGRGGGERSTDGGVGDRVRVFDDLDNVENTIFALDSVWAVTSNLPNNYSRGEADASVLRIDPATGESKMLLDGIGVEPTFASLNDRVWVKLENRIVAFDASGTEVASLPWKVRGDMFAGEEYLWVTDVNSAQVSVIDPATAAVVRTIETGRFPISPIVAFGHAWIPSAIDGTVTIVDGANFGGTTSLSVFVTDEQLTDVTAVPGGASGDEVWVTDIQGELFAIGAQADTLGALRDIPVDRPVNRLVPQGDRIVLLPTWGRSVLIADLATGETLAEIPIDSIPFRAVGDGDRVWIASDGGLETLTQINARDLTLVEQFQIGIDESVTTGPTQPLVVNNEIWVPNRGDNAIFAVTTS